MPYNQTQPNAPAYAGGPKSRAPLAAADPSKDPRANMGQIMQNLPVNSSGAPGTQQLENRAPAGNNVVMEAMAEVMALKDPGKKEIKAIFEKRGATPPDEHLDELASMIKDRPDFGKNPSASMADILSRLPQMQGPAVDPGVDPAIGPNPVRPPELLPAPPAGALAAAAPAPTAQTMPPSPAQVQNQMSAMNMPPADRVGAPSAPAAKDPNDPVQMAISKFTDEFGMSPQDAFMSGVGKLKKAATDLYNNFGNGPTKNSGALAGASQGPHAAPTPIKTATPEPMEATSLPAPGIPPAPRKPAPPVGALANAQQQQPSAVASMAAPTAAEPANTPLPVNPLTGVRTVGGDGDQADNETNYPNAVSATGSGKPAPKGSLSGMSGVLQSLLKQNTVDEATAKKLDKQDMGMGLLMAGLKTLGHTPRLGENQLAGISGGIQSGINHVMAQKASRVSRSDKNFSKRLAVAGIYKDLSVAEAKLKATAYDKSLDREQRAIQAKTLANIQSDMVEVRKTANGLTSDKNRTVINKGGADATEEVEKMLAEDALGTGQLNRSSLIETMVIGGHPGSASAAKAQRANYARAVSAIDGHPKLSDKQKAERRSEAKKRVNRWLKDWNHKGL